ncbi:MAG TPA: OmpH family outer membrane protein [Stellaceae bacterium]|nr:OmpH family outer membrane protein [Stellaceae bacterium]
MSMSRIRRAILAPTAVLLLLLSGPFAHPSPAAAQAPAPAAAPAPSPPQNLRVVVVDIQTLLQKSKAAQMVRQQIEQKSAEYRKEIAHQEQVLHTEQDALQREQPKLSPAALNKKGREFQQKVTALNRNVEGKRAALEKANVEAFKEIQGKMLKIIDDIAKERHANLIFQSTSLVLFDKKFDVTDEVLQKLDKDLPSVTVNFVASPPPPATAATGAATKPRRK